MSLNLVSLSSGSKGNCIAVFSEDTCVLIDAGISARTILNWLKPMNFNNVSVLITHTHSDHIGQLKALSRHLDCDVFCHCASFYGVNKCMGGGKLSAFENDFFVGNLTVSPFKVSHDVPCVGYSVYCGGKKLSVVTDTGQISSDVHYSLSGSDLVFLEANHDENLLKNNANYPYFLKKRILSLQGHLSNNDCALTAQSLAKSGTRQIVLGHLSEENNYPELAYSAVCSALKSSGINAGSDVHIDVARFARLTPVFKLA